MQVCSDIEASIAKVLEDLAPNELWGLYWLMQNNEDPRARSWYQRAMSIFTEKKNGHPAVPSTVQEVFYRLYTVPSVQDGH